MPTLPLELVDDLAGDRLQPLTPRAAALRHLGVSLLAAGLAACGGGDPSTAVAPDYTLLFADAAPGCTPQPPTAPLTVPPGSDHLTLCWGAMGWNEPTRHDAALQQNLDFYPARQASAPLIVWAHPNGMDKTLPLHSALRDALLPAALQAGYAFASVEFRHPVVNAPTTPHSPVPHTDLADALVYLAAHAQTLGIDARNIFLVGQSRGTLGVWTAMQANAPAAWPRVRAVFGVNAQTSYDGNDFAQWFLVEPDRAEFLTEFQRRNPNAERYGSAVRDVTPAAPPVHLRYDAPVVPRQLTLAEMGEHDALHYPNFGPALCEAYARARLPVGTCGYEANEKYKDRPDRAFAGYVQYFDRYRVP